MSFNKQELKEHCLKIIQDSRIRNKIVILCEGLIPPKVEGRRSPQLYKQMEQMPDANFYHACVPTWWKQYRPIFFNCGDRNDVLNTFFGILDLHNADNSKSFLSPDELFAVVDLDVQLANIKEDYIFENTEDIFYNLYHQGNINDSNINHHRIWITGLIHKEAYFLKPDIQEVFDNQYTIYPLYKQTPVNLEKIYLDMVNDMNNDADLHNHWSRVIKRISHLSNFDDMEIDKFQYSWQEEYENNQDLDYKNKLINAVLMLVKSKEYWRQISPDDNWNHSPYKFREQLSLKIGTFYSKQDCIVENHIPFFFKSLYELIE
ncbi:hypothetical protein H6G54_24450 [Anabaena cylindrica FACHB-243]|uniref:DUF4435 domain-containing protein n=1 Tax=Anabaena cylindrica (strain ATCC 27899 / PCC 7122) TaxID=272123 RepID=K9ZHW1_ANACC|nr:MULTISPECIES: hypothetical protein [Anabaena]AFZ58818.1 hypothetical protein Anacy_3417 [Anabaena cylindrica PCC 7122]MBD2420794.1 hypothetical protein [Anabaena cylindrica FACHB-243]MBY5282585.1 hypothetical protein [Anabaena sp. CCAP 1446/1C]MBY5311121.1 hypothetical protein [Anabaena sp. CCAP 1446/1C]MCM2409442.1 hypothetical protein [Anabaena sp. CCAP 1446/1C]